MAISSTTPSSPGEIYLREGSPDRPASLVPLREPPSRYARRRFPPVHQRRSPEEQKTQTAADRSSADRRRYTGRDSSLSNIMNNRPGWITFRAMEWITIRAVLTHHALSPRSRRRGPAAPTRSRWTDPPGGRFHRAERSLARENGAPASTGNASSGVVGVSCTSVSTAAASSSQASSPRAISTMRPWLRSCSSRST